jgi:hypothetical protein
MLHSLRRRLQDAEEREAAGQSVWADGFNERVRNRLEHVFRNSQAHSPSFGTWFPYSEARRMILEQEGLRWLVSSSYTDDYDFHEYFRSCDDAMFPTLVEAIAFTLQGSNAKTFARNANEVFAQERVGWEIIDGRMVKINSKELHGAAVEPAIRLLHKEGFEAADQQYRDALEELAQGKAADAITDAGATLQEVLEALGCEGNQLGDLARSARKKELLGAHDTPLVDAIERTIHWVAADRSEMGDTHHATQATREDAWLIVHVVGALVVRLAAGQPRTK